MQTDTPDTLTQRLKEYLKFKKITIQQFEHSISRSNGYVAHTGNPTANVLADIIVKYPDLNIEWLIMGAGRMIKRPETELDRQMARLIEQNNVIISKLERLKY
jgi:hypothetical protein